MDEELIYSDPYPEHCKARRLEEVFALVYELVDQKIKAAGMKSIVLPVSNNAAHDNKVAQQLPQPVHAKVYINEERKSSGKLLLLIQNISESEIRRGFWNKSVALGVSLEHGTMLQEIRTALDSDIAVIVSGHNEYRFEGHKLNPISNFETPEEHILYIWDYVVANGDQYKEVFIVAQDDGGNLVIHLKQQRLTTFREKVKNVAFVFSRNHPAPFIRSQEYTELSTIACNYRCPNTPLEIGCIQTYNVKRAGMVPHRARRDIFSFFQISWNTCGLRGSFEGFGLAFIRKHILLAKNRRKILKVPNIQLISSTHRENPTVEKW